MNFSVVVRLFLVVATTFLFVEQMFTVAVLWFAIIKAH
jgi:hypothetical protein